MKVDIYDCFKLSWTLAEKNIESYVITNSEATCEPAMFS